MSNSTLIDFVRISPNSSVRTREIDTITIHHMAGNLSVETCGAGFAETSRKASANYGIGSDGRVGMYVPENRRAWTSSSTANDNRAVTIEVANIGGDPTWPVSDAAYCKLLELCEDICRRYGKTKMVWLDDSAERVAYQPKAGEMGMTVHRDLAATLCPGPYLMDCMPEIARTVTSILQGKEDDMPRYNTLNELPKWARETVQKLCDRGIVKGKSGNCDADGYPVDLDLTEDMARMLVWNDRAGLYDWQSTNK